MIRQWALAGAALLLSAAPAQSLAPADLAALGRLCTPTHIGFSKDTAVVSDLTRNVVHYKVKDGPWQRANLVLNGHHSVTPMPNGDWILNDTDNHRMIQFRSFEGGRRIIRGELAGFKLRRPHDQIVDPNTGHVYVIDGDRRLFRFKRLNGPVEVWSFSEAEMGYARSLSWFDGKLHIIHSSRGEVLRVDSFEERQLTRFASPGPGGDDPAGALSLSGLVLNDVEFHNGWYYGTNYFTDSYAKGASTDEARLIRWRNWEDFTAGRWEDLSAVVPKGLVPYYLTAHEGALYLAIFNHEDRCEGDAIVKLPY
jgi:hypothetical protein